jgi:hypothetical protein
MKEPNEKPKTILVRTLCEIVFDNKTIPADSLVEFSAKTAVDLEKNGAVDSDDGAVDYMITQGRTKIVATDV